VAAHKHVDRLDGHCRDFLARTTLAMIATSDGAGRLDSSPCGGPPAFIRVHDDHHLLLPDAPGNRRVDTFSNLLSNPRLALCCFVPRYGEVLRIEGRAWLTRDGGLRDACTDERLSPAVVVVVRVEDAFLHCAKAVRRSALWDPPSWLAPDGLASAARIWRDHTRGALGSEERIQELVDVSYGRRMW
jgi:PPOX class probable FMN-dependent enzyme